MRYSRIALIGISLLVVTLHQAMCFGQNATGTNATDRTNGTQIGYRRNGQIFVEGTSGWSRLARPDERTQLTAREPTLSSVSPDGKFRAVAFQEQQEPGSDYTSPACKVINSRTGAVAVSSADVRRALGDMRVWFAGWLPDSRHIAVYSIGHMAGYDSVTRCVVSIVTRHIVAFNGWPNPTMNVAIVPNGPGLVKEDDSRSNERDRRGGQIWDHTGPAFAAITLTTTIDHYHHAGTRSKVLLLNGKPLRIKLDSLGITFSKDGKWALYRERDDQYETGFVLISLTSGKARKISGSKAQFIVP